VRLGHPDPSGYWWSTPVVAETWDSYLNYINGFHVRPQDAYAALDSARGGPVAEGNVGAGTGTICHEYKCGIGTASRRVVIAKKPYILGVLVQANYGVRDTLRIAGVPVGQHLQQHRLYLESPPDQGDTGSIIIVVATDAPLLPHQLKRIARRAAMGIARTGGTAGNGSGDIFLAFSTANPKTWSSDSVTSLKVLTNDRITPLFQATAQATEAAITNALLAAETTTGANDLRVFALPVDRMLEIMRKYGRLK